MGTVQVTPKVGSYVDEWVGVIFNRFDGIPPVKKLLKGTGWVILEAVLSDAEAFLIVVKGTESWRVNAGDWVVKSPHDKVWFMSDFEFKSQFLPWEEI